MNIKTMRMGKQDKQSAEKFLEELDKAYQTFRPDQPMSEGQSNVLVALLMSNGNPGYTESLPGEILDTDETSKKFQLVYDDFQLAQILYTRLEGETGRRMTLPAVIFVGSFLQYPGDTVMTAHYIHRMVPREKGVINIDDCVTYAFGSGVWSDVSRRMIWGLQKRVGYRPDNWYDYREVWI